MSGLDFFLPAIILFLSIYHKSSIKPPPPGLFISNTFKGGLFNLAKTMVSVLHKKLEYKVEKLKPKKLEVMQLRIKNKSELPVVNKPE